MKEGRGVHKSGQFKLVRHDSLITDMDSLAKRQLFINEVKQACRIRDKAERTDTACVIVQMACEVDPETLPEDIQDAAIYFAFVSFQSLKKATPANS